MPWKTRKDPQVEKKEQQYKQKEEKTKTRRSTAANTIHDEHRGAAAWEKSRAIVQEEPEAFLRLTR